MNKNLFKAIALLPILFGTMLLAVPVTGPVKTWTSGEILTSADLNSTINSLKAAIEGISTATTTSTATATSTSVSSQWATNGTNISYTNGNVGIGTVTPLGTLAVQGTGTGTGVNFQTANSSGTSLITALDNGNVGIGTSSPTATLSVKGTGTGTGINFQTANSSGTSLITALDNGNVGIGTSSPVRPVEIVSYLDPNAPNAPVNSDVSVLLRSELNGARFGALSNLTAGFQAGTYRGTYTSKSAVQAGDVLGFYQAGGYDGSSQAMNSGNIVFYAEENFTPTTRGTNITFGTTLLGTASRTEKMRITANGNVGIGTTSPTEKLEVAGNIKIVSTATCTLGGGTGTTSCSSDARMKKDISPLKENLNKILSLKGVSFFWKKHPDAGKQIGILAQDVEKVFPELVTTDKETGFKMVAHSSLIAPMIESIKELKVQHDEEKSNNDKMISNLRESNGKFEKENAELKAANEALKKRLDKMERAIAAIEKRM